MNSVMCSLALAALGCASLSAAQRFSPALRAQLPPPAPGPIEFARDIRPILEVSCIPCHGRGKAKGGFSLETRAALLRGGESGPAAVPGNSAESYLVELVSGLDPDAVMPQKGRKLSAAQVSLLRGWIDRGLPWEENITFAKLPPRNLAPRRPELPPADGAVTHPIDRWLRPYFAERGIAPPTPIDDRLFARRAWLDVLGLLPAPAELTAFQADPAPDKRERLVDRLLGDHPRYAEHWLSFWNDALRNDYRGTGYIDGGRKPITAWLFAALRTNLPYDRFVAELVHPTPASEGFVKGIVWRGAVNSSQTPEMQAAQNIAQLFMGVNLKCASCHDSFISDWTLADAYGLAAVYANEPLEMHRCDQPTGQRAVARFLFPELGEIPADAPPAEKQQRLAGLLTSPQNGRLARTIVNRLWQKLLGVGLVEPVDDMDQPAWHPELLDWLAEDCIAHGYDLKHTLKQILTSRAYQLPAVNLDEDGHRPGLRGPGETPARGTGAVAATRPVPAPAGAVPSSVSAGHVFTGPAVRRMSAEQFRDALGTLTGVWYEKPAVSLDPPPAAEKGAPSPPAPARGPTRASLVPADPLTAALGRPPREQMTTRRPSVATTLQALELTNGETLSRLISAGAKKLLAGAPDAADGLVRALYEQALARPPAPAELELALQLIGQPLQPEPLEDFLWSLAMLPEFQLIY